MGLACASNRVIFVYEVWAAKTVDFSGILAPKGPKQISPGQRPGCRDNEFPVALKGRNKERTEALPPLCCALSGLKFRMLS